MITWNFCKIIKFLNTFFIRVPILNFIVDSLQKEYKLLFRHNRDNWKSEISELKNCFDIHNSAYVYIQIYIIYII